jgi:hypothetical protein
MDAEGGSARKVGRNRLQKLAERYIRDILRELLSMQPVMGCWISLVILVERIGYEANSVYTRKHHNCTHMGNIGGVGIKVSKFILETIEYRVLINYPLK